MNVYKKWVCMLCEFLYDADRGYPPENVPPGTPWTDVPADFKCPMGHGKGDFEPFGAD
ncbi:MAG TPA: rubredoxin [Rhizomicrobium sp.]|jgi:rubredoxin|nr:rubredoxin [Rhizomicrobium sp.]